ncbi:MAG: hypothetical protein PHX21_13875 [bacterium]|nr:hypothetical protein [bacterium]
MEPKFKLGEKVRIKNFGFQDPSLGFCRVDMLWWNKSPENIDKIQVGIYYFNKDKKSRMNQALDFLFAHPAHLYEVMDALYMNKKISKFARETFDMSMYDMIGSMLIDIKDVIKIEK